MIRLRILVEGESEEDFVNEILAHHLLSLGILATATGVGESRGGRGIVGWKHALRHIRNSLREDEALFVTTLVDYYALPASWPGRAASTEQPYSSRASFMARHMADAVLEAMGPDWMGHRFIPNVLIHEFETLLFSDPAATSRALALQGLEADLRTILAGFESPEQINDAPTTCPSRRIAELFKANGWDRYEKPIHGNIAILGIGLATVRQQCPQFGLWLEQLENLGSLETRA